MAIDIQKALHACVCGRVCVQLSTSPHTYTSSSPSSSGDGSEEGACERLGGRFEITDQVDGVQPDKRQSCPTEESVRDFEGVVVGGAESGEREESNGDQKNVDEIGEHEKCLAGFRAWELNILACSISAMRSDDISNTFRFKPTVHSRPCITRSLSNTGPPTAHIARKGSKHDGKVCLKCKVVKILN